MDYTTAHIDLNELPKVELHCHLLGVISPQLIAEVSQSGAVLVSAADLGQVLPISKKEEFQEAIDVLAPYQAASWQTYAPILAHHLDSLLQQNVVYTELMISPLMFPQEKAKMIASFRQFRQWVDHLEREQIQVEFLMVLPRSLPSYKLNKNLDQYLALFAEELIVGVAVVGLENGTSIRSLSPALERFKEAGLGIEVHAGEHSGPEDIWEALNYGFADRIGHGVSAFKDPKLLNTLAQQQIHLEFCLTSNGCTGSVPNWAKHPIRKAKALGLSFSINTDDPGLFDCHLTGEFQQAKERYGFTIADFKTIYTQALAARFRPRLKYLS